LLQIGSGCTDVFGAESPSQHAPFWHERVKQELELLWQSFKSNDFASNPNYLYFDLVDAFLGGGSNDVIVKITYWDNFEGP